VLAGLKNVILWNYPRASWQYDIMVAVIVAFVFLTPREWFHDQPRIPQTHEVALLPSPKGTSVFWLEPEMISSLPIDAPDALLYARVNEVLKKKNKTLHDQSLIRVDRVYNSEHELMGYMAAAKP
jgi:hypothetical protein